jgi:hypothetical protein
MTRGWLWLGLILGLAPWAGAQRVRESSGPAEARLLLENREAVVHLRRRDGFDLIYRQPDAPLGVEASIDMRLVYDTQFEIEDVEEAVMEAVLRRDWLRAGLTALSAVEPFIPFLDMPNNNGAYLAYETGAYLLRAARRLQTVGDLDADAQARALLRSAAAIYSSLARATWFPQAEHADLLVARALLFRGQRAEARQHLESLAVPGPYDPAYGLYRLVSAELHFEEGDHHEALEESVRSVAFQNKDVTSFPDALLLSAAAYEAVGEMHRARDARYEVVRLFPQTDWEDAAAVELERMMAEALTEEEEDVSAETVFFGLQEDMNQRVRDYLEQRAQRALSSEEGEEP